MLKYCINYKVVVGVLVVSAIVTLFGRKLFPLVPFLFFAYLPALNVLCDERYATH